MPYQELLFPGGSMDTVLPVYKDGVVASFYNDCVVAAVRAIVDALPEGRLLRDVLDHGPPGVLRGHELAGRASCRRS